MCALLGVSPSGYYVRPVFMPSLLQFITRSDHETSLPMISIMTAVSDIDRLPPQVRRIAQKSGRSLAQVAHRIAGMPPIHRRAAYVEADAMFRKTAEANGLIGLMVERYIRHMRHALKETVAKIDGRTGFSDLG